MIAGIAQAVLRAQGIITARRVVVERDDVVQQCTLQRLLDPEATDSVIGSRAAHALTSSIVPTFFSPAAVNVLTDQDATVPGGVVVREPAPWSLTVFECAQQLGSCFGGAEEFVAGTAYAVATKCLPLEKRRRIREVVIAQESAASEAYADALINVIYGLPGLPAQTSVFAAWMRGGHIHTGMQASLFYALAAELPAVEQVRIIPAPTPTPAAEEVLA